MRRFILVALVALTFSIVATTGHARLASPDDAVNPETHPIVGTWIVQDPRLDPNAPVVLAFDLDGSAVQLTVDGAARVGTWRIDDSTGATARLSIPDTQLGVLVSVRADGGDLSGGYSLELIRTGGAGSAETEVQVDVLRELTATRIS